MDFVFFLGRFHVLVLHLPIGLIVAVVLLEWLSRKEQYRNLAAALPLLWGATAISALVTVLFGYFHFAEGGFDSPSGTQHRLFGTVFAVLAAAVALLRSSRFAGQYTPVFLPASAVLLLIVFITGHYGGNLTHGSTYLVEYAPQPIRAIAGLGPRRPPVTDLMAADPFEDIVLPIFERRCTECHSPDKRQGELDLSSHSAAMRGGETGSVIVARRPDTSELLRRVTLPASDEAFMPAEGKTPLTDRQVSIVEWWIAQGAATGTTVGQLELPAETEDLLREELGLGT